MHDYSRNSEGYKDKTAYGAIRHADRPPDDVYDLIRVLKDVAYLAGYDIFGRVWLRDRESGKEWR